RGGGPRGGASAGGSWTGAAMPVRVQGEGWPRRRWAMRRRVVAAWVGLAAALGLGAILPSGTQAPARTRGQAQRVGGLPLSDRAAVEPIATGYTGSSPPGEHLVSAGDPEGQ